MKTISNIVMEMLQNKIFGVFNVGCRHGMSKSDFGLNIAKRKKLSIKSVQIGKSDNIQGRVQRPHDMRLDVNKLEAVLGRHMNTLNKEITKYEI